MSWKQIPPDTDRRVLVWVSFAHEWQFARFSEGIYYFETGLYLSREKQERYVETWAELPPAPKALQIGIRMGKVRLP